MTFASDIEKFAEATKQKVDQVVRQAVVLAAQGVVMRSPVGNPQLWKVNADHYAMGSMDNRLMYNAFVDEANATRGEGEKKMRRLGKKRLKDGLKFRHSDYVGGRFRANWQLGIGVLNTETTENVDAGGNATLQKFVAGMANQKAGGVFWVSNSLPYAHRLEFEGWSTQSPNGMVRITIADLPQQIEAYARSLV